MNKHLPALIAVLTFGGVELMANTKPVIKSSNFKVKEGISQIGLVRATDKDNDTLTFSLSGTNKIQIDASSGSLSFINAADFEDQSLHRFRVKVSDGTASVSKRITVRVKNVNEKPKFSKTRYTLEDIEGAKIKLKVSDPEGNSLSYELLNQRKVFSISDKGVLQLNDVQQLPNTKKYNLKLSVSDGKKTTKQTIKVTLVPKIVITFSSNKRSLFMHNSIRLKWKTKYATSCMASDNWEGSQSLNGTKNIKLKTKGSYQFTLTCSNSGITSSKSVSVKVKSPYKYATHWDRHKTNLDIIDDLYVNPVGFNLEKVWFKTLSMPLNKFTTSRQDYFLEDEYFSGHVGVDAWFNYGNKTFLLNCNWNGSVANGGSLKVFEFIDQQYSQFIYKRIDGCNHPFNLLNQDGSSQLIFLPLDESDDPMDDDTHTFDMDNYEFNALGIRWGSHGQAVFDYEQDGDQDIISNTFVHNDITDGNPIILRNNGNNDFDVVQFALPLNGLDTEDLYKTGTMSASAFYDNDDLKIVFTDFNVYKVQDNEWGIELNKNVIATYDPSDFSVKDVEQLPTPYAEVHFTNIEGLPGFEDNGNGISHDVRSTLIDIDYDGDLDIIIGNQVYGEDISIPQFIMNNDGTYEDETDSRLFNWFFATGGMHRWNFADVNNDGYLDMITSDGCVGIYQDNDGNILDVEKHYGCERKVAINDGDGHFVVIIDSMQLMQIKDSNEYKFGTLRPIFGMDSDRNLFWLYMDGKGCNGCYNDGNMEIFTVNMDGTLSTGPNGMDPALVGEEGYNEFYYLLHNAEAKEAVANGEYENGLEHYIAVGKKKGLLANAKTQTAVVVDSYNANPQYSID